MNVLSLSKSYSRASIQAGVVLGLADHREERVVQVGQNAGIALAKPHGLGLFK